MRVDYLDIQDESHFHHSRGEASHLKVVIVSPDFEGQSQIQRSRRLYQILIVEFQEGLHALSLKPYTPQEWRERGGRVAASPPCASKATGERS